MKQYVRILGCLTLATVIGWRLDWGRFAATFARLDVAFWLLALGIYVGAQVVSSLRWRLLAGALGFQGSPLRYLGYYYIGMFFNLALPSSVGGDVARGLYLANQEGEVTVDDLQHEILPLLAEEFLIAELLDDRSPMLRMHNGVAFAEPHEPSLANLDEMQERALCAD